MAPMTSLDDLLKTADDPAARSHFRIFTLLWVTAGWFHLWNQVPWPHMLDWSPTWTQLFFETGMLTMGIAVFGSRSLLPFLGYVLFSLGHALMDMPRMANHWYITFLSNLVIVGSFVAVRRRDGEVTADRWLDHFAVGVRWVILVCYTWAAWAKLNTDFVSADVSCAATTYNAIATEFLPVPTGPVFDQLTMWGTIAFEFAIPVLLLIPRARHYGVLLGLLFHYGISVPPHLRVPDFAFLLFASWWLFLSTDVGARVDAMRGAVAERLPGPSELRVAVVAPVLLIPLIWYALGPSEAGHANVFAWGRIIVFSILGVIWLVTVLLNLRDEAGDPGVVPNALALRHPWHVAVVLLGFVTGLAPYIGSRTGTTFAMFSNLHTEAGHSNHLVMPSVELSTLQRDMIRIERTSAPSLQAVLDMEPARPNMPFWELRYRMHRAWAEDPNALVVFERGGETHEVASPSDDPELLPVPAWQTWWLYFHPTPDGDRYACVW